MKQQLLNNMRRVPGTLVHHPQSTPMYDFEPHRAHLFAIAYRMTGSVMEAEDILHDAYLRYQAVPREAVQSPRALLSTIVTRFCLNHSNPPACGAKCTPAPGCRSRCQPIPLRLIQPKVIRRT